jgi:hypothetical protein
MKCFLFLSLWAAAAHAQLGPNGATASFKGSLPPKPTAALSAEQEAGIENELGSVTRAFVLVRKHPRAADAEIFLKAVRYALDFDEWYDKKPEDGVKKARVLLDEAKKRIAKIKKKRVDIINEVNKIIPPGPLDKKSLSAGAAKSLLSCRCVMSHSLIVLLAVWLRLFR